MVHRQDGMLGPNGEYLDYSRLDTFGHPYMGIPELLPRRELERKTVHFKRFGFGLFDISKPSQLRCNRKYGDVMEGAANNGWEIVYRSVPLVKHDAPVLIYLEWYESYGINKESSIPPRVEDDQRNPSPSKVQNASPDKRPRPAIRRRKPKEATTE